MLHRNTIHSPKSSIFFSCVRQNLCKTHVSATFPQHYYLPASIQTKRLYKWLILSMCFIFHVKWILALTQINKDLPFNPWKLIKSPLSYDESVNWINSNRFELVKPGHQAVGSLLNTANNDFPTQLWRYFHLHTTYHWRRL